MSDKWECDSCGKLVDEKDIDKLCGCKGFMGYMRVGGPAWHDYHDYNIHPMKKFTEEVKEKYEEYIKIN